MAMDVSIGEGILRERSQLAPVRESADVVLDTTELSITQLRQSVIRGGLRVSWNVNGRHNFSALNMDARRIAKCFSTYDSYQILIIFPR